MLIAADGGAAKTLAAGLQPHLVIGDGDSLAAHERMRLLELGVEFRDADADKDESDTELCLLAALNAGARRISMFGALGGDRPEHSVANMLLLVDPRLDDLEVEILDGRSRMVRIGSIDAPGRIDIDGTPGDFVSLFPLGGSVQRVRTDGLRFPLRGERLELGPSRGLSNELLEGRAQITTDKGVLLVVHTAQSASDRLENGE